MSGHPSCPCDRHRDQHIAGCAGARHIIAINTDPGTPILAHADYAVIGDLHEVIPALVAALRAR